MVLLSEALAKLHCDSEVKPKYVKEAFRLLKQKLDVEGKTSAYTVLGLEPGAPTHPAGRRRRFVLVVDRQNNPSELCLLRESRLRKPLA